MIGSYRSVSGSRWLNRLRGYMTNFVPTHIRFIVSMLLGSVSSGVVWTSVLIMANGPAGRLSEFPEYVILISLLSMIVLVVIGWPIFAIFRRTSRIGFRVAASIGFICGLFMGAFSLRPLDSAWVVACSLASATAAAVSWWWSYRPKLALQRAAPPQT